MKAAKGDGSAMIRAFGIQARACHFLGSPLTAYLLRGVIADYQDGGISRDLLANPQDRDEREAVTSLRLAGALHYLVLSGRAPGLASYYPSAGGTYRKEGFLGAVERTMRNEFPFFATFLQNTPQTNEVRRAAALIGGFMRLAASTGLPLRCLEVGASAGLNLNWDRFSYVLGDVRWGDPAGAVTIATAWNGPAPATDVAITVAERAGCDISPIDPLSPDAAIRLKAYVWADHLERLHLLESALALARRHPVGVETADAGDWTARQLAESRPGLATVLYHSIAAQYFSPATRGMFERAIRDAGARATRAAPFAWLRMEQSDPRELPEVRLTMWPGGQNVLLGTAHPHGVFVNWKEPA